MKGLESGSVDHSQKKLRDAKGEKATQERCRAVLEMIAPGRVKYGPSGRDYYVELPPGGGAWWVYLRPWDNGTIATCVYPGNNMSQARTFFNRVVKQKIFELIAKGWQIQPTLALNFVQRFLPLPGNKLSLEQYFDFWASEEIRQIRREGQGFEDFSHYLRTHRLINATAERKIREEFIESKRTFMNVCPGFELVFAWRRAVANRLDQDQLFVEAVRARANEALQTWGQTL